MDKLPSPRSAQELPLDEGWWRSVMSQSENGEPIAGHSVPDGISTSERTPWDWPRVEHGMRTERIFICEVVGHNQGGLLVADGEIEGFLPISHLVLGTSEAKPESLHGFIGRKLRLRVIECDRSRSRIVFSERAARSPTGERQRLLEALRPDQLVRGVVTHITKFGLFVDIGGVEGLVHISELSWERVPHPRACARVGDGIEAVVLKVDGARGRVALSMKRLSTNPWDANGPAYTVGEEYAATVTELVHYGAFARLEGGVEGLMHISQMSLVKHQRPWEVIQRGQRVAVRILSIDNDKQRLSLALVDRQWPPARDGRTTGEAYEAEETNGEE